MKRAEALAGKMYHALFDLTEYHCARCECSHDDGCTCEAGEKCRPLVDAARAILAEYADRRAGGAAC